MYFQVIPWGTCTDFFDHPTQKRKKIPGLILTLAINISLPLPSINEPSSPFLRNCFFLVPRKAFPLQIQHNFLFHLSNSLEYFVSHSTQGFLHGLCVWFQLLKAPRCLPLIGCEKDHPREHLIVLEYTLHRLCWFRLLQDHQSKRCSAWKTLYH